MDPECYRGDDSNFVVGLKAEASPKQGKKASIYGENHVPGMVPDHPELRVPGLVGGWRPPDTEYMCPAGVARAWHMLLTGWEIFDCPMPIRTGGSNIEALHSFYFKSRNAKGKGWPGGTGSQEPLALYLQCGFTL